MALTFTKTPELNNIYPVYNECWIEFVSDVANIDRCEILVEGYSLDRPFVIYPDNNGVFLFNLKSIAQAVMKKGFEDEFDSDELGESFNSTHFQTIQFNIKQIGNTESTESRIYSFQKSSVQIGQYYDTNKNGLLSYTKNGIDYKLPYFEGFPFFATVRRILGNSAISFKRESTGVESIDLNHVGDGSFRFWIDKGDGCNFTSENFMPLDVGLNTLKMAIGGQVVSNIIIQKREVCEGVYLKWFNREGDYSFYLFDRFRKEDTRSRERGLVSSNEFENVGEQNSVSKSSGKMVDKTLNVKANVSRDDYEYFEGLFSSPHVEMYSSFRANEEGKFFRINIEGTFSFKSETFRNEVVLKIDLPEIITARL